MIEQGRHNDYETACQQHPGELVALQVRDSDGNPVYLFYGENVVSLLPPNLGISNSYGETSRRIPNAADMQRLAGQGTKAFVGMSYYDAIPKEKLYDIELQDTNVRSTYKKTLDEIGMLQYPYIPKGFIRASPPYLSQGVFVMNVESIGGRAPRYAVRELDKNDVAAYKNGEMLLEELVLKFNSKAMDKKCSNLDTPLWQLSTGEFLQLLKDCLNEKSPKNNKTVATKVEEPWVYGIDGIAKIFNCSRGTAMNIKKSGIINPAIKQVGRKIVVDVQQALELAGKKGGRNG